MNLEVDPDSDFIDDWLSSRVSEGQLDRRILGLLDKHREREALDEEGLLKSLIALSSELGETDGAN